MNKPRIFSNSGQPISLKSEPTSAQAQAAPTNTYLKFQLDLNSTAAIAVKDIEETITVKSQHITAIPNVASCNLGLMTRKNQIIWVIDLAAMLQLEPLSGNTRKYTVVVIKDREFSLGLAVKAIEYVFELEPALVQPVHEDTELTRHLNGYVLHDKKLLFVLDTLAIVNSPVFHNN